MNIYQLDVLSEFRYEKRSLASDVKCWLVAHDLDPNCFRWISWTDQEGNYVSCPVAVLPEDAQLNVEFRLVFAETAEEANWLADKL